MEKERGLERSEERQNSREREGGKCGGDGRREECIREYKKKNPKWERERLEKEERGKETTEGKKGGVGGGRLSMLHYGPNYLLGYFCLKPSPDT